MSVETLNNPNEDLFQENLYELKNQIDKPWQVKYLRESNDGKYKIYSYKLVQWWNRGGIKNKYEQQIWKWIEWTQFSDEFWNIIDKTTFKAWEIIYLRVPKNKENYDNLKEMSSEEVMKLSNKDIEELYNHFQRKKRSSRFSLGTDEKWWFLRIDNKKLYHKEYQICDPESDELKWYNWPFFHFIQYDSASMPQAIEIWIKKWNNIEWFYIWEAVYSWNYINNNIKLLIEEWQVYKWRLNEWDFWLVQETK